MVTENTLHIATPDGVQLQSSVWMGAKAHERSVVFLPGIAAPRRYLRSLAVDLARRGWGVMTFDYRGVGGSSAAGDFHSIVADHWIEKDLPAAITKMRLLTQSKFLGVFAHSLGGQLLGQSPAAKLVDGALFLACQRGMPYLYRGRARLRVEYAYRAFPVIASLWGEIPVSPLTFPERTPPGAVLQWVRWGKHGKFCRNDGTDTEPHFSHFRGPLVSLRIEDDFDYAPEEAVAALERLYSGAILRTDVLRLKDLGIEQLGHFGPFSPRAPKILWSRFHDELMHLTEN